MRQTGLAMPGTEPKDHRTTLIVEEAGRRVTLHQQPTPDRRVESWMTYTVAGPAHLDFTFRYRLHDPALFTRGFAGFFFANYIHEPENKSIYVLSRDGGYPRPGGGPTGRRKAHRRPSRGRGPPGLAAARSVAPAPRGCIVPGRVIQCEK